MPVAGRRENCESELNTWRSARKHADPELSRGDAATVRGRVIAACAAAGNSGRALVLQEAYSCAGTG